MRTAKQLGFRILEESTAKHFGGMYLKNSNAKTKRPLSFKRSVHLVLRSSLAKGERSFLRKNREIQQIINAQGKNLGVKVYKLANAGNHLHLLILPHSRRAFHRFIRAISGLIARAVLGVERGKSKGLKFWDKRPFTQIVEWGRQYRNTCKYLMQNTLEALGFIPYQPRKYKMIGRRVRAPA